MLRVLKWLLVGALSVSLTVLAFLPATWLASSIEQRTGGRIVLGNAQGTVWRGSAIIGAASGPGEPAAQLLPGRFSWTLSPMLLLGAVDMQLHNPQALAQPVQITGSWRQWRVTPSAVHLPAERLAGLGAPLNTLQPSGKMQLSWNTLQLASQDRGIAITGAVTLHMQDIASRLSPIRPLGDYRLLLDWQGQQAKLALTTNEGPLLLNGSGAISNGHFRFSGTAEAEAGYEERLANLLNLLGQRRHEGGKDVIALEFK